MTDRDRDRLRTKQDHLLRLAAERHIGPLTHISYHPAAPRLGQLEAHIWPDWEATVDWAIAALKGETA